MQRAPPQPPFPSQQPPTVYSAPAPPSYYMLPPFSASPWFSALPPPQPYLYAPEYSAVSPAAYPYQQQQQQQPQQVSTSDSETRRLQKPQLQSTFQLNSEQQMAYVV